MNTIQLDQIQNIKNTEMHSIMTEEILGSKEVTVGTKEGCYIPTEKTANASEALTFDATVTYLTYSSLKTTHIVNFLKFVSVTTKKHVITLPGSKNDGKSRKKYIEEDQFLTTSRKEGDMAGYIRESVRVGDNIILDDTCTHGTNLYSFLVAVKISDGYLLPLDKQIKRLGLAQTGESKGNTPLNKKYVSSVGLSHYTSCFVDALRYAEQSTLVASSPELFASQILNDNCPELMLKIYEILSTTPVVTIGYGISRGFVKSSVSFESIYKRIKVRTVAVPNEKTKNHLESLLPKINQNRSFKVILISELERIDRENPPHLRNNFEKKPDYIELGVIDPE